MAVRIYTLAKELKLDSKVLVDICTSAGVVGKGSALASLTDEEVERVKAYLGGAKSGPARAPVVGRPGATTADARQDAGAVRREDYIAPGGASVEKVPVLADVAGAKTKRKIGDADVPRPAPKVAPGIKLAPLPTVQQPTAEVKSDEPAPQRPDLKLPADAIRASRIGAKPLAEHLRKHEQKRTDAAASQESRAAPAPGPVSRPGSQRDKGVRKPLLGDVLSEAIGKDRGRGDRDRDKGGAKTADGPGDADRSLLGGREQRQLNRKRAGTDTRRRAGEEEEPVRRRSAPLRSRRVGGSTTAPRKTKVTLDIPCTVRSFSAAAALPAQQVLRQLLELGTMANINAEINRETAELLAVALGLDVEFHHAMDFVDEQVAALTSGDDDPALLAHRPPVITFLGHVDHGKTSLLDRIIGIDVASGESGGITQHIRAYEIEKNGRRISFVDTPGHEAFTEMRARGANVTDIAVLVVAADDGVMPQTEEAISHARAAGVPIVVALNKIDLPGVDTQRTFQQLATAELLPTEWGGDTEVVKTSATKGEGIDDLLETLLTIAELHDYKANPTRSAMGTCLEAELHEGRGVVAKLIVQSGTLNVGDVIVCGEAFGRVKAMYDTLKPRVTLDEAGPSTPVNMTGFDVAPGAGERFYVVDDVAVARQMAQERAGKNRRKALGGTPVHVTLENLFERLGGEKAETLNLILRADVRGSIEAIQKELTKLDHPEVKIKVLQATVGGITEADVHLADASDAIIIGFNVVPDEGARVLAERCGVQIRRYDIIYKLTEDLKAALVGMLKPEEREVDLGRALVLRTFSISRVGTIAGCRVLSGTIQRGARVRVIRDNRVIGDYPLESLKREKDDAREVREGYECGMKLGGFNDVKEGDVLEVYRIEEVARTF